MTITTPSGAEGASSNYRKYQTRNPLMRKIIERFLGRAQSWAALLTPATVVDLGCGEGLVAQRIASLPSVREYRGYDLVPQAVEVARRMCPAGRFEAADIVALEPQERWADLAVCLEVLEHLDAPERAVERIHAWTNRYALVSVPWEPYFRAGNFLRGKYVARLGNHPEHVQRFGPESLSRLLRTCFATVHVDTCFPWLIAVARKE